MTILDLLHLDEFRLHGPRTICTTHRPQPPHPQGVNGGGTHTGGPLLFDGVLAAVRVLVVGLEEERDVIGQGQPHDCLHLYSLPFGQVDSKHL